MNKLEILLVSMLVCCADEAVAQSLHVWPPGHATTNGNSAMASPLTVPAQTFQKRVITSSTIRGATLPFGAGTTITHLSWRRDAQDAATNYPQLDGFLVIKMGPVPDALQSNGSFNYVFTTAPGWTVVRRRNPITIPARGVGNAAFIPDIALDEPYAYSGGDIAIVMEFELSSPASSIWRRDANFVAPAADAIASSYFPGCVGTNGFVPHLSADLGRARVAGSIEVTVDLLPRLNGLPQFCVLVFGTAPILPVPLTVIGSAPSCQIVVSPIVTELLPVHGQSVRFGRASLVAPIANVPALAGATVFFQAIAFDAAPSSSPTSSNGLAIQLGPAVAPTQGLGRTAWRYGALGNDVPSGGQVSPIDYVPVWRFTTTP